MIQIGMNCYSRTCDIRKTVNVVYGALALLAQNRHVVQTGKVGKRRRCCGGTDRKCMYNPDCLFYLTNSRNPNSTQFTIIYGKEIH